MSSRIAPVPYPFSTASQRLARTNKPFSPSPPQTSVAFSQIGRNSIASQGDRVTFRGKPVQANPSAAIHALIRQIETENLPSDQQGLEGEVWLFPNLIAPAYPNGLAIKRHLSTLNDPSNTNPNTAEREGNMLQALFDLKIPHIAHLVSSIDSQGKTYLAMPLLPGSPLKHIQQLQDSHYRDLFNVFFHLDKASIYNYDCNDGNLLITPNSLNIIDVGQCEFFRPDTLGEASGIYTTPPSGTPANYRSFEGGILFRELKKLNNPELAQTLFKNYLRLRSDYHQNRANHLSIRQQQASPETQKTLGKALHAEELSAALLKKPTAPVIASEAIQCQLESLWLDMFNHLDYDKGDHKDYVSAFTGKKAGLKLIEDYRKTIEPVQNKTSDLKLKAYLTLQLENMDAWQKRFEQYYETESKQLATNPFLESEMRKNPLMPKALND